jgi:hypothetical protein
MTDRREPRDEPSDSPYTPHQDRLRPWNRPLPIFTSENDGFDVPEYMFTRPDQPTNGPLTNGHTISSHITNRHTTNGETINGETTNGEPTSGRTTNGHISNSHTTNGRITNGHNSSFQTRATRTYATRVIEPIAPIHQGINGTYRPRHHYRTFARPGRHRIATDGFQDLTSSLQEPEQRTPASHENIAQTSTTTQSNGTQTASDQQVPDMVSSDDEAGSDFEVVEGGRSEPNGQTRGWFGTWFRR